MFEGFDGAMIAQLILLAVGATGATGLAKRAISALSTIEVPAAVKQLGTIVFVIGLAWMSGVDLETVLPGGGAGDGAIAGIIGALLYKVVGGKKDSE